MNADDHTSAPTDELEGLNAEPAGANPGCLSAALDKLVDWPTACTLPSCPLPPLSARGWGAIAMGVVGGLMVQLELFGSPLNHPTADTIAEHTLLGTAMGAGVGFGLGWLRELMFPPSGPTA